MVEGEVEKIMMEPGIRITIYFNPLDVSK